MDFSYQEVCHYFTLIPEHVECVVWSDKDLEGKDELKTVSIAGIHNARVTFDGF